MEYKKDKQNRFILLGHFWGERGSPFQAAPKGSLPSQNTDKTTEKQVLSCTHFNKKISLAGIPPSNKGLCPSKKATTRGIYSLDPFSEKLK